MTVDILREFFGWCFVINYLLLMIWYLLFTLAHDWMYRLHGKWFKLSVERFDSVHYASMGFFKLSLLLFNLTPYIALCIAG